MIMVIGVAHLGTRSPVRYDQTQLVRELAERLLFELCGLDSEEGQEADVLRERFYDVPYP